MLVFIGHDFCFVVSCGLGVQLRSRKGGNISSRLPTYLMAVQCINVESFFCLRKFIGPKNPLLSARIAYFVILRRSAKNMAATRFETEMKLYVYKSGRQLLSPDRFR